MRAAFAVAPLLALGAAGGAAERIVPGAAGTLVHAVGSAAPLPLAAALACYALSLTFTAASWRLLLSSCGGRLTLAEACRRYAAGSLVNTLLPARAGDAVRIGLFARTLPGSSPRLLLVAGAVAALGVARWTGIAALAAAGASSLRLTPLALPVAGVVPLLPLAVAGVLARRGSTRAAALLAPVRSSGAAARAGAATCVAGTLAARVSAAALVAAALSLPQPIATALLVVPALELAGIVPLTPGNLGVGGGAAAVAFHLYGAPLAQAAAAGLTLQGLETVASLLYGGIAALDLARRARRRHAVVVPLRRPAALREAA
jgi:uncharacterized membrane protein YbhN (UPF0104 family)